MPPRLHVVRTPTHSQQTPAPLLLTKRGQFAHLPPQLAAQATPAATTLLLQLPLADWHILNSNSGQRAAALLKQLSHLPSTLPSHPSKRSYPIPRIAALTAQLDAILFLTARAASSRQTLTAAPGKSLAVRYDALSAKSVVTPQQAAELCVAMQAHFVIAPTDAPPFADDKAASAAARRRRALRSVAQVEAFGKEMQREPTNKVHTSSVSPPDSSRESNNDDASSSHVGKGGAQDAASPLQDRSNLVIASIQGGFDKSLRITCAKAVAQLATCRAGISIDGLYAGEGPDERDAVIQACVSAVEGGEGVRVLTGGSGAPWEVLRAVARGVDVVEADFPFEMAESGLATRLCSGGGVENVRQRRWETSREPIVPGCACFVCNGFMRGYVRHLFEVQEMMGVTLVAAHNLWDYLTWFGRMRDAIAEGSFTQFEERYEEERRRVG